MCSVYLLTCVEHQVVPGGWPPYTQSTQELWLWAEAKWPGCVGAAPNYSACIG